MKYLKNIKYLLLLTLLASTRGFAEEIPSSSTYDMRMQSVSYNREDVAKINAKLGFITTVVFSEDEIVEKAITGFDAGWKIESYKNKLFIMPVPVEQQTGTADDGEAEGRDTYSSDTRMFEPVSQEWNTNLFVSTNKHDYSMSLNVAASHQYANVLHYSYPDKIEATYLKTKMAQDKYPRNWNYFVKANNKSQNIVPDFAYDDGEMTYLGFSQIKQLPSIFLLNNKKEQTANYSVEQQGNFKVLAVHNLSKALVLRYGDLAVGILNKSFGKYVKPYSSTISKDVARIERNNA